MSEGQTRQQFIDWMKAVGMMLILIGHVMGGPYDLFNAVSEPVYSKQLGVAFFVFVAGWGLARASRPRWHEAFNRVFAIYLFGAICAVVLSVIYAFTIKDINESNYLPLIFGVNVFFNYFPANPTTWYIGMYLHLILLWALLVPQRIGIAVVLLTAVVEIGIRTAILGAGRSFTAYMLVTNWMTVFAIGHYLSGIGDERRPSLAAALAVAWVAALTTWYLLPSPIALNRGFPTRLPEDGAAGLLLVSLMVTAVYTINTLFAFAVFRRLGSNWPVRFIARNTLLIFILHMPLIYAVAPRLYREFGQGWLQQLVMVAICVVVLGALSEIVNRALPVAALRDWIWNRVAPLLAR